MEYLEFHFVPGLVIGCIYAIAASGLVMTYSTSGVLNIGYGAMAYSNALIFYELRSEHEILGGWAALALCVLVIGPLLGVLLWQGLFRWLVKLGMIPTLIASIGIAIALPALCELIFKPYAGGSILYAAGVSDSGQDLHLIGSIPYTVDQAYAVGAAILVAAALFYLLRFSSPGLRMRAVFDSRSVAALTGTNPEVASNLSWAIGGALAAIGGVFLAPVLSLSPSVFLTLTVASIAAALVGGLRSIPLAFGAALLIGLASSALTGLNSDSILLAKGVQPSLPFLVMAAVIILRRNAIDIGAGARGVADSLDRLDRLGPAVLKALPAVAVLALVPVLLDDYWTGVVAAGLIYGIIFLSLTLALGYGGMLSLGQAGLVGIAAFAAGDLASNAGVPLLLAVLAAALIVALVGAILAFIGGRLNVLEFGLLTLAFGLFVDNFLYNWTVLVPLSGTSFPTPSLFGLELSGTTAQYYLFAVVLGLALLWVNWYRRRLAAFYVAAIRMHPALASATGINPRTGRVLVFAAASFLAGIGGGLLGIYQKHLDLTSTAATTTSGLVWLAVIVFMGIRSPAAAVVGGIVYSVFPALLNEWLPLSWAPLATVLFGLGALALAQDPRGAVAAHKQQASWVAGKVRGKLGRRPRTA